MSNPPKNEICKGCKSIIQFHSCIVPPIKNGKICPCSICLVKTMCNEPCEEFKIHADWGKSSKLFEQRCMSLRDD